MRRGHPNQFGWRNDMPRQFRPRGGGPPGYRPSRHLIQPFNDHSRFPPRQIRPLLGLPAFPPPQTRPPPFKADRHPNSGPDNNYQHNRFEDRNKHSYQCRDDQYDSRNRDGYHVNTHGDVDQRFLFGASQRTMGDVDQRPFNKRQDFQRPPPWAGDHERPYDKSRTPRTPRYEEHNDYKLPTDYTGHRPPASDHYEQPSVPAADEAFSRSVDDTVDIIRKRLLNRNDPQSQVEEAEEQTEPCPQQSERFQETSPQKEPTPRKKLNPSKQILNMNCNNIKNKIVHQLFKMDKERMHKLMNNPNSSSKFEFAISSLINESQNSLNRHLRSAAEKSLCGPSNQMQYPSDTDAIYDDTFMKQMQCILDPQDTIILEDIKPFVLAELNKVLGLDVYQHMYDAGRDDEYRCSSREPHAVYPEYSEGSDSQAGLFETQSNYLKPEITEYEPIQSPERGQSSTDFDSWYARQAVRDSTILFERRQARTSRDYKNKTPEQRLPNFSPERSRDVKHQTDAVSPEPFFNPNAAAISEEEIFEELDRQYHVAVDCSFIAQDYTRSPSPARSQRASPPPQRPERCKTPKSGYHNRTPHSPFGLGKREPNVRDITKSIKPTIVPLSKIKQEADSQDTANSSKDIRTIPAKEDKKEERVAVKKERLAESSGSHDEVQKPDSSTPSKVREKSPAYARKRSSDQKPSHRKEKRKKSDTTPTDQQITNKNIIINVNDCLAKQSEQCDTNAKSVFNLYFSKDEGETSKEIKKKEGKESEYSDKYVKKKEAPKTSKAKGSKIKQRSNSTSSNHSIVSPKDNACSASQTPNKSDSKTKYKSIDIFSELPRKPNVPQPQRNTASTTPKTTLTLKHPSQLKKPELLRMSSTQNANKDDAARNVRKNHKETQTTRGSCFTSRFVQTVRKKTITRGSQTQPVSLDKKVSKSPFERMKEIDMEIQNLLQEKFGLYNSLESKETTSMKELGMAVLSVADNNVIEASTSSNNEDTIINDFSNIPEEELEQMALESAGIIGKKTSKGKKWRKQKLQEEQRNRSESPATKRKKAKTPNISLIEQIITDDRPIEDIISLDDLETLPQKQRKKNKANHAAIVYPETKECSVVLLREDLSKKIRPKKKTLHSAKQSDHSYTFREPMKEENQQDSPDCDKDIVDMIVETVVEAVKKTVEDTVEIPEPDSEFHFDMLEVSEDIVIGDVDKVAVDTAVVVASEVVLDNSQSEDDAPSVVPEVQPVAAECRMYDYTADEDLKHDSVSVSGHTDAVLAIECIDNSFLAACLDGSVYHFGADGQLKTTLRGSNLAVTCLTIVKEKYGTTVYTGSLDSRIRYFDLDSGLEKGPECNVLSPIQTMDRAWDTVFVGTRTGFVLQFECKNNMLIPISTIKFSDQSILALRALKEGPRKVLLVAARSESVTIKDAQSGLLLRTLAAPRMTVYTLLYEDGKVYCGTSSNMIEVFDYASGAHTGAHAGGKGCVCLRSVGGVLFAGCYDGCVYVFVGGAARPLAQLRGPAVMLLSLCVAGGKMIAGYKDRSLYIWKIPDNILQEMIL